MYTYIGARLDELPQDVLESVLVDDVVRELFLDGIIDAVVRTDDGVYVAIVYNDDGSLGVVRAIYPNEVSTQEILAKFY